MKVLKSSLHVLIMIIFELAVGIMLFINPEAFTTTVIIFLGITLLLTGIAYLIRYLKEKRNEQENFPILAVAVISLIVGIVFTFFSGAIIGLITAFAIVYGMVVIISGIYKLQGYFADRKSKRPVSPISLVSGILAVILGIVIVIYPKDAAFSVWSVAGIILICEAVIDCVSIVHMARTK